MLLLSFAAPAPPHTPLLALPLFVIGAYSFLSALLLAYYFLRLSSTLVRALLTLVPFLRPSRSRCVRYSPPGVRLRSHLGPYAGAFLALLGSISIETIAYYSSPPHIDASRLPRPRLAPFPFTLLSHVLVHGISFRHALLLVWMLFTSRTVRVNMLRLLTSVRLTGGFFLPLQHYCGDFTHWGCPSLGEGVRRCHPASIARGVLAPAHPFPVI